MDTVKERQEGETQADGEIQKALAEWVTELDHVAIAVVDLESAIDWYETALGFRLVERRTTHGEHTSMISAQLVSGRACVVLVQGTSRESQVSRFIENFGPGVHHVAFQVDDLDAVLKHLGSIGLTPDVPVIEDVGIRQLFLPREPGSGVRAELIERRGGDFSDFSVEQLYRAFESRDLY